MILILHTYICSEIVLTAKQIFKTRNYDKFLIRELHKTDICIVTFHITN